MPLGWFLAPSKIRLCRHYRTSGLASEEQTPWWVDKQKDSACTTVRSYSVHEILRHPSVLEILTPKTAGRPALFQYSVSLLVFEGVWMYERNTWHCLPFMHGQWIFFPVSLLRAAASINFVPGLSFLISGLHTMEEEKTLGTCQDPHFKGAETGKVNEGAK